MIYIIVLSICISVLVSLVGAQQEMRSTTKGSSTPLPVTGNVIHSNCTP